MEMYSAYIVRKFAGAGYVVVDATCNIVVWIAHQLKNEQGRLSLNMANCHPLWGAKKGEV